MQGIVRLIIERLEIDINNIRAVGYYYFLDENNELVKLDDINSLSLWNTVSVVEENLLNPLNSTVSLKDNLIQRLNEFTMIQLTTESGENYSTTPDDWENEV